MRTPVAIASAAVVSALLGASSPARADSMDPAIERLTGTRDTTNNTVDFTKSCSSSTGGYTGAACAPNNAAFAKLINQLGVVIAPTAMHSARTTGFGSFHLTLEGAYTGIDNNASYWKDGTRGPQDPTNKKYSIRNDSPASLMQLYSLKIRKGFPFGLEVSAQVGTLSQTTIVVGGADIRMSILEGFRKGALGILPDLAVGGGVRTITGTPQFNLTVASFDVQLSKNFPIAESHILAPYVAFQQLWIFGDSGLIDATPSTDPLGTCNYSGINTPGNSDPAKSYYDGQPNCSGSSSNSKVGTQGTARDFNNTFIFDKVRLQRQRFVVGTSYRYEYVFLGGQFSSDLVKPEDAGGKNNSLLKGEKKQTAFAFEVGAFF